MTRGNEFWTPEPLFRGQTVFVVGGGPSLKGFDFNRLAGQRVVAVNSSGYDLPGADVLLFHDTSWFADPQNRALVDAWRGIVVTLSRRAKAEAPDRLCRVECMFRADFPIAASPIRAGLTSGHSAVSLAITMAAARVVLLGFDMRADGGATHYHTDRPLYTAEHATDTAPRYATFLPGWRGWNDAAKAAGCEVLNATPGSALLEFPAIDLETVL